MSHKNPPDVARVSRIFFYILMFAILGWFIYMQFFGADERRLNVNSDSMVYTGTFTWEKSDGTSEEITVPGDMICLWVRQWFLPHVFRKTIMRIPCHSFLTSGCQILYQWHTARFLQHQQNPNGQQKLCQPLYFL